MLLVAALLLVPAQLQEGAPRAVHETVDEGLWLSATAEAAWLDDDLWLGTAPGLGVELDLFALHVRAPLYVSAWDAPPVRDETRAACAFVRCRPFVAEDGTFDPAALSQLVEDARLGRPGDWLYARAGPVFATLGRGRVVDRYLSAPRFDRQSGLYARAGVEPLGLEAEVVTGNLFAPERMTAGRLELRPFRALTDPSTFVGGFLSRARVDVEGGADLVAGARPLLAAATTVAWPLLEEGGWLGVEPWASASALSGLERYAWPGVGAAAGVRLELRAPLVGLRVDVEGRADGAGHRAGVFGTVYEIERTRALAGGNKGVTSVPAPGGVGFALGGEVVLGEWVRAGARFVDDTALGADTAEAWTELAFYGLALRARAVRRGVTGWADVAVLDERTLLVAESSLRVWGGVSVFARWYRTPRALGSALVARDEVVAGVSGDLVLLPGFADDG